MTDTHHLIAQLSARAMPVKRIGSPLRRTALWALLAAVIVACVVLVHGARPDWMQALRVPHAALEWCASVITGLLAAYAVFQISVPGRSPSWAWLPLPAAALWLSGIGLGCLRDFARIGSAAFVFEASSRECAWAIALTSLPLMMMLIVMVRHAGVVRPVPTAVLAALSAAALSAAGVSLIHPGENSLMVLLWHVGAVIALSAMSWLLGRQMFAWIGYARR